MSWAGFQQQGGGGVRADFVREGNADVYVFTEKQTRCRFLTEDVSAEDVMKHYSLGREAAAEKLNELALERWLMPKPYWEHTIKDIPNVRFFSTSVCQGRGCQLCTENATAKENGVTENKLLPFPVRKRFYAPAWFYDLGMVLFVKAAEDFFVEVANYVDRYGSNVDFEIFKTGKGFNTRYKVIYVGPSTEAVPAYDGSPLDFDPRDAPEELERKVKGGRREGSFDRPANTEKIWKEAVPPRPLPTAGRPLDRTPVSESFTQGVHGAAPPPAPEAHRDHFVPEKPVSADFVLPFGQHKGKTFRELVEAGNRKLVTFYSERSTGQVQAEALKFVRENPGLFA